MSKATEIVRQIEDALQYYSNQDFSGDVIDVGSCGVASTYDCETASLVADNALKLIPQLLAEIEGMQSELTGAYMAGVERGKDK